MKVTIGELRKVIREEALREARTKAPGDFKMLSDKLYPASWKEWGPAALQVGGMLRSAATGKTYEVTGHEKNGPTVRLTMRSQNDDEEIKRPLRDVMSGFRPANVLTTQAAPPAPQVSYITRGKGSPISGMEDVTDVRVESLGDNVTKTEVSTDGGQNWVTEPLGIGFIVKLTSVKGWTPRSEQENKQRQ